MARLTDYLTVTWHGTVPPDRETDESCLEFDLPGGGVLRLKMHRHSRRLPRNAIALPIAFIFGMPIILEP